MPQQYPINYHHPHLGPQNPYVNQAGINLGLVSVNPLVSVQVTKDDYGEKVVKPYVNLHVTPNNYLVDKVTDFFAYKKHHILNNHYHNHVYKPGYGHGHGHYGPPHHYDGPFLEHPPHHYESPNFHHPPPHHYDGPEYLEHPPHGLPHSPSQFGPDYDGDFNAGYGGGYDESFYGRAFDANNNTRFGFTNLASQFNNLNNYGANYNDYVNKPTAYDSYGNPTKPYDRRNGKSLYQQAEGEGKTIKFPTSRRRRDVHDSQVTKVI